MRTLKMLVLVVAITFSSVLSASTNENAEPASINETVGELLKNHDFQLNKDVNAMVTVLINQNDEMVVLSLDTDSKVLEKYIMKR
jgi:hypothetical protein